MSVECKVIIGHTVELARDLSHEDFEKCDAFIDKYPELDEYNYHRDDMEGKLLLIGDGMNGSFLRLVKVDRIIEELEEFDFVELPTQDQMDPIVISKMFDLYEEYTGRRPDAADFKYAVWSQWS